MTPRWMRDLLVRFYPRSWAAAMEAESREWMVRCRTCGAERSVWELGGVRWKAKRKSRTWMYRRCPDCGRWRWHDVYRRKPTAPAGAEEAATGDTGGAPPSSTG
jgi:ribosomal protein S14